MFFADWQASGNWKRLRREDECRIGGDSSDKRAEQALARSHTAVELVQENTLAGSLSVCVSFESAGRGRSHWPALGFVRLLLISDLLGISLNWQ